jgi:hypothetical protein
VAFCMNGPCPLQEDSEGRALTDAALAWKAHVVACWQARTNEPQRAEGWLYQSLGDGGPVACTFLP